MAPPAKAPATSFCRHLCCLLLAAALFCAAIAFFTPPFEYKGVHYEASGAAPHVRRARAPGRYERYVAARAGDVSGVRDLLRRGARVDAATPMGVSALHIAASLGRTDVLRELLAAERGVFSSAADVHGNTPLLLAASGGHVDAVRMLLAAGADVKARTVYDLATPMMRASRVNNLEVTTLLLKSGSDPDMIDVRVRRVKPTGSCARVLATSPPIPPPPPPPPSRASSAQVDGRTALTYAAEEHRKDMVQLLVESGAGIDIFQLSNGMTPLMCVWAFAPSGDSASCRAHSRAPHTPPPPPHTGLLRRRATSSS